MPQENTTKIKITREGQPCRRCNTPVVKKIPTRSLDELRKKNPGKRTYYYDYYFFCPNCRNFYMVEEVKHFLEPDENYVAPPQLAVIQSPKPAQALLPSKRKLTKAERRKANRIKRKQRAKSKPAQQKPVILPESVNYLRSLPYPEYLKSAHWKQVRDEAVKRAGFKCQLCSSKGVLNVHHNNYKNLGRETEKDLITLCRGCHAKFHDKLEEVEMQPLEPEATPTLSLNEIADAQAAQAGVRLIRRKVRENEVPAL